MLSMQAQISLLLKRPQQHAETHVVLINIDKLNYEARQYRTSFWINLRFSGASAPSTADFH